MGSSELPQRLCQRAQGPALKVEAEKRNHEVSPVAGEEMEKLVRDVMSQPPAVIERMKKVLGN